MSAKAETQATVDAANAEKNTLAEQDKDARCAQLLAQGNLALAQAEGCGGGSAPIYSGSLVSLSQSVAPFASTLPYNNSFAAMSLYLAPRIRLTDKWALSSDITLAYEFTKPDDTTYAHELYRSDTRVGVTGLLFTVKDFTFTGGARVSLPTSKSSWASKVFGTGVVLNVVRQFDVLDGLAFSLGTSYTHNWSKYLTRPVLGDAPPCTSPSGDAMPCSASNARLGQDSIRATGSASLNFTQQWNIQASYFYGWNLAKPFKDDSVTINDPVTGEITVDNSDNTLDDNRWRRFGYLGLSASYQPVSWFIGSLQTSTGVCYDSDSGSMGITGGCAGGGNHSDFFTSNPIINKFSTVSLQLTVPVDAFIQAITSGSTNEQKKTAKAKSKAKL